ncbi:DUF222 domain-containing protein [Cryobacterium sp. TMT1-2-2]|uniref:DUF222 domain-containing protein n=1 Tax=Cryobacterium sp. TMT1-2-2 TaxID=1259233 RepID=UPI00106D9576|nr:DUF222 domain-containing protein [Cryobacterium sp. TMT1-2-2]TFD11133.1 DUF222 domain-containing protein [Cryobacterium sp. TMT1-2-2]
MNNLAMELTRAANAVAALGGSSAEFAGLSDAEVLAARVPIAALLRLTNTAAALLAGTIAERSRPQLGQSGLAARHGFGNPTLMVQHATGLSRIEAGRLVAVGVLMSETETAERDAAAAREATPAETTGATQTTKNTRAAKATSTTGSFGYFEGSPAPVSKETIDRHLCDAGYLGILFSQDGQPLNVGRDERLFNRDQRRALAARDGGCRWPGCDRPPSWSEAHHLENWADLGLSNIDQAILLCAHHHLLLHNKHWKILLLGGLHWLHPRSRSTPSRR